MNITLFGRGKMGTLIEKLALAQGHQIVPLEQADICIDFSHPDAVLAHLEQAGRKKKNLIIGTTGWDARLEEAKTLIEKYQIGVMYAPNFSIGVLLFLKILEYSAKLVNHIQEYSVAGIELHHAQKKDAPSGTALEICRRLEPLIDRIDRLDMTSVRLGSIPGKHLVLFDSPFDTISLCHEARNREGFALGALKAAQWLIGKQGFYTLEDLWEHIALEF